MRRKSFLIVAVLLIASLVLGACAETTEAPTEAPTAEDPWANVTPAKEIVWWHQHTGEERENAINQILSDFNSTNEWGITVTAEYAGSYNDIFQKMLPILNTPEVPDVVAVSYTHLTLPTIYSA